MSTSYQYSYLTFLKQFPVFILLLVCFQIIGITYSFIYSQADLFLWVNQHHHQLADQTFMLITDLGDWPVTLAIAIIFLFVNWRHSFLLISTMLYTGFFTQVIKMIVKHPRPAVYFEHGEAIYTIKDYVLQNSLSFPSGHTTCVFSLAITLSYIFIRQRRQPWLFLVALVVALSRVYLSQHFFKDLLAGSLIGTFFALHLIWLFDRSKWFHAKNMNSNLLEFLNKGKKPVS
ncbi:phosphatase PAP2 family protein [Olivibacter sp. CPCC 100613]|uniref:phosphatase PAP2 family protein n=1 Tax=Olivibacter sp. CPCC 100613 TaxID=3079931 RepID=UPI002FF87E33